jgi:hypothetical protein
MFEKKHGVDWVAVIRQNADICLQGPMSHQEAKEITIEETYVYNHKATHIYALNKGQAILAACLALSEKSGLHKHP